MNDMIPQDIFKNFFRALANYPVTLALIIISLACYPVGQNLDVGEPGFMLSQMTFLGLQELGGRHYFHDLSTTLQASEYWRLFTPMFLHFSLLHLVFNMVWVWDLGRRIETVNGNWVLIILALLASLAANLAEFSMTGPSLFGGMSGVVFGMLGFSWVFSRLVPSRDLGVMPGIYVFMLIYLIVGFTGAIDQLGLGSLANWAHLGGLVAGLIIGAAAGLTARLG